MKKVKAGVIGIGFVGPLHVEALRRTGLAEVIALAHSSLQGSREKAEQLGIPRAYGDYRELLADPEIECVHICTPNDLHFEMTRDAMLAGKHVICEKPLALDEKQGANLVEIAQKTNVVNAMHFNLRFYPIIHQIREMVQSGELGEIFAINGSYTQDWLLYDSDYNWRVEPSRSGSTRTIADIGSHWCDCAEFISGASIQKVCADFAIFHQTRRKPLHAEETFAAPSANNDETLSNNGSVSVAIKTEDYANVLLRFGNGARGCMMVTQCMAGRKNRLYYEIMGSRKSISFDAERPNELWIGNRNQPNQILQKDPALLAPSARAITSYPPGHDEGYNDTSKQLFTKVYRYILAGGTKSGLPVDFPTFAAGQRALTLCEAMLQSNNEQAWIEV